MAVFNLGSINADNAYRVPRLAVPGETLAATDLARGLGGKGANMSVAAARAAARVVHIGAVGEDGRWAKDRLMEYGVDTRHIAVVPQPTGHANICIDAAGENTIVLFAGANHAISQTTIGTALAEASPGDFFVTQNETNAQTLAARTAKVLGLKVVYAAAPFDAEAVRTMIPDIDLLILNTVEAAQLEQETGSNLSDLGLSDIVVTRGSEGSTWISAGQDPVHVPAVEVEPVDTTGAGDTFTGYLIAGLDRGMPMAQALGQASLAAAMMVTRMGTADVIPDLKDLQDARLG